MLIQSEQFGSKIKIAETSRLYSTCFTLHTAFKLLWRAIMSNKLENIWFKFINRLKAHTSHFPFPLHGDLVPPGQDLQLGPYVFSGQQTITESNTLEVCY